MSTSSCHNCRKWHIGLRSDFSGGPALCGPCRDLKSIGNLIGSEAFIEEDGPAIWKSIIGLEDHLRDLQRQRRKEEEEEERVREEETERAKNEREEGKEKQGLNNTSAAEPVSSDEYTYTDGSEEETAGKDCPVDESSLPGVSPKAALKRPPSPPAPRRESKAKGQTKPADKTKPRRAGGGQKRKEWLKKKIEDRRDQKARRRDAKETGRR